MGAKARFTEAQITRALKGAKAAGYTRVRLRIDVDGTLTIEPSNEPMEDRSKVSALDLRMFGGPR